MMKYETVQKAFELRCYKIKAAMFLFYLFMFEFFYLFMFFLFVYV